MTKFLEKWASILFLLGILILVNVFVTRLNFLNRSLDFTKEKFFTLSEGTENIVNSLPDLITIKAFVSGSLPDEFSETQALVEDILHQIAGLNSGKIKLEILDPKEGSRALDDAKKLGITPVRFQVIKQDQYASQEGYFGLAVVYKDKFETIPSIKDISNLEYQIALDLKKVSSAKKPRLAIWKSTETSGKFANFEKFLSDSYDITDISGSKGLNDYDGLLMLGGFQSIPDADVTGIKTFISSKKPAILLIDKFLIEQGLSTKQSDSKLFAMMKSEGFDITGQLVLDQSSELASFMSGPNSSFISAYPYWVKTLPPGMNNTSGITSTLNSVSFPWATKIATGPNVVFLVQSSDVSWLAKTPNLYPDQKWAFDEATKGPHVLLAQSKDGDKSGSLVVGSTSRIFEDQFLGQFQNNILLALNTVDSLMLDQNLSLIRAKEVSLQPLPPLSQGARTFYKLAFIFGLPLLVGLYGIVYLNRRKNLSKIL